MRRGLQVIGNALTEEVTAEGLRRYYRDLNRRFRLRLVPVLLGAPVYALLFDWRGALVILLGTGGAELLEARLARRVLDQPIEAAEIARLRRRSVAQGTLYAASVFAAIALIPDPAAEGASLLAVAIVLGAAFDAGFLLSANRVATLAKVGLYALAIAWHFAADGAAGGLDRGLAIEVFAAAALAYFVWMFVVDVRGARRHQARINTALAERGAALERALADLTAKERAMRRLALAAEHANDSIVITDPSGRIEWVNGGFTARTGWTQEEVADRPRRSLSDPANDPATFGAIDAAVEARRSFRGQLRLWCRGGRSVWHDVSLTPVFGEDGRLENYIAVEHDISELKAREAELARREAEMRRLALVAEHARDAVVLYAPDGRIEWVNPGFTAQTGYEAPEVVGRKAGMLVVSDDDPATFLRIRAAMAAEREIRAEIRLCRKDGGHYWCEVSLSPVHGEDGRLRHYVSVERDISELKAREAELARTERENRRLALVARHATDCITITGPDRMIEWVNQAFLDQTGYALDEVVGRPAWILNGPETDPDAMRALAEATAAGRPFRSEMCLQRRDGSSVWHDVRLTPVSEGDATRYVGVERDVTEAKAREVELAEARRAAEAAAEAKSRFLATMSHEIRTPMNGIIGTADLLAESALDPDQRRLLRTIALSSEALLRIINDILDLSKLEAECVEVAAEPFAPAELAEACAQLLRPLAERKGLDLVVTAEDGAAARLIGDPGRLQQIVLNLLGNAIKFTEGGRVELRVGLEPIGDERRGLRIAVTDTGIGIEPDRLGHVFDAFTQADGTITRRFGGTGLGLSISRKLAHAMGGELRVASKSGEGSTFALLVDLPPAGDERAAGVGAADGPSGGGLPSGPRDAVRSDVAGPHPAGPPGAAGPPADAALVLLVEDNATNRFLVQRMLDGAGVRIAVAEDGAEGVAAFERLSPELVIMDVSMPVMDGFDATRRIRAIEAGRGGGASCPILALTANAHPDDRARGEEAGVTAFLTKPVRKADLRAAVAAALRSGPQGGAARAEAGGGAPPGGPAPPRRAAADAGLPAA